MIQPLAVLDDRKYRRATLAHVGRVPLHHLQIRSNGLGKIDLVHHQQVRPGDTRPALARDLVAARDVNHVDDEVGQFARVVRSEVITAGLDQEEIGGELPLKVLERKKIGADIFPDCGVRTSTRFDGTDSRRGEGFVAGEELGIFPGRGGYG